MAQPFINPDRWFCWALKGLQPQEGVEGFRPKRLFLQDLSWLPPPAKSEQCESSESHQNET